MGAREHGEVCVRPMDGGLQISAHGDVDEATLEVLEVMVATAMASEADPILVDVTDAEPHRVLWQRTMLRLAAIAGHEGGRVRIVGAPPWTTQFVRRHGLGNELELTGPQPGV